MSNYAPMRSFRCEDELYLKVKHIAIQEDRSVNKQIVRVLSQFVAQYESQHGEIEVNTDELYK
jgi:predicted transcriptional regulator